MKPTKLSRRDVLASATAATFLGGSSQTFASLMEQPNSSVSILREPDVIRVFGAELEEIPFSRNGVGEWVGGKAVVSANVHQGGVSVSFHGEGVSRIQLRWKGDYSKLSHFLGDHWERSYADLGWEGVSPNRVMPWYFMAYDGKRAHGFGVRTGAGAMCFWTCDPEGVSLWADIRSGGLPVALGDRTLQVAEVVWRLGLAGESPFAATRAFCSQMSLHPRIPSQPTYGTNDWNFAYGNNSAELIAGVSGLVSELSENTRNRPFSVIDEGWAMGPYNNNFGHGPWEGNPRFGDMGMFASRLKGLGVRPGIWFRPLTPLPDSPESWKLARNKAYLDPTIPEVQEHVRSHIRKMVDWGYELIKHDFTSWDLFGQWGFQMGASPTKDGWKLRDSSRTNAEVLTNLYGVIREAAGDARLIGCNTVGHLATGFHEIQRIGDDTSGRSWNRNRRMGVNTLAFRAAQHRSFFEIDPDIVSITTSIPWNLVEQWMRLVSQSGAALFVAMDPKIIEAKHRTALRRALSFASVEQPIGEPLDWLGTNCPAHWRLMGKKVNFEWMGDSGAWPFPD